MASVAVTFVAILVQEVAARSSLQQAATSARSPALGAKVARYVRYVRPKEVLVGATLPGAWPAASAVACPAGATVTVHVLKARFGHDCLKRTRSCELGNPEIMLMSHDFRACQMIKGALDRGVAHQNHGFTTRG